MGITGIDETLLTSIITQSHEGFFLFDSQKKIIFVNDIIEKFCGYTKEEIIGTSLFDIVVKNERYLKLVKRKLDECYSDHPFENFDLNLQHKNGKTVILHFSGSKIVVGKQTFVLMFAEDITKKKEVEKVIESTGQSVTKPEKPSIVLMLQELEKKIHMRQKDLN